MRVFRFFIPLVGLLVCAFGGVAQSHAQTPLAADGFSVNNNSREEVRQFYNAVYAASQNVPINSSAELADCYAGTNATDFQAATLRRINWFRGMAGIPAVTFSDAECAADESAALMVSVNEELLGTGIPPSWSCFDTGGTNACAHSDLQFTYNGADAITQYIWEYGANNAQAGHRRWILYPQTQVMASGDVPTDGIHPAANATWVVDTNFDGPRPPTTWPFTAWPPPGYAPYPVVFPRWSLSLSNADFTNASVSMLSNGVPMSVTIEPSEAPYGEAAIVWYPSALDPSKPLTDFPFDGGDTTYEITVNNIVTSNGPISFNYAVTVFDPAVPGADSIPIAVSGTNRPSVNENNPYVCAPAANPNHTSYQWLAAQTTNGNLVDNAAKGLANFTIFPKPFYSIITNTSTGKAFHLTHTNPAPQLLELKEILWPATNTTLTFQSQLEYATSNETARVQISTNGGGDWADLLTQAGTNGPNQKRIATYTLSLARCAGELTLLRFDFDYAGGAYYGETSPNVGWILEHIRLNNTSQLVNWTTNFTSSTDFDFVPPRAGSWILQANGVLFGQYAVGGSPASLLTVITNEAPILFTLGPPTLTAGLAQIPFTISQGGAAKFQLVQADDIVGPWRVTTNASLTTLVPGSGFQFVAPATNATTFFRALAQP